MQARLEAHRRALHEGDEPPASFVMPSDVGPLPVALRLRAEMVLEATRRMEAEVEHHRDALIGTLRRNLRMATEGGDPAYLDARL
ncbi:MAG TPA: hypothetical protein VEH82_11755 [Acidimicrobiales bacterium]|nr:hypothetical protein [Acidimicrobiales bacterium]